MLVDRRHFVRLIGMASAVGAAVPSALARTAGDHYFNDRLQLSIVRPKGWRFLSLVDFRAASRHHLLAIDDPDVVEFFRNPEDPPFLVITKFGSEYGDFNPCITCWDEAVETGIEGDLDCHRQVLSACRSLLAGVSVIEFPAETTLSSTSQ